MTTYTPVALDSAAAQALALMVAANGRAEASEFKALEELKAYERMGLSAQQFRAQVQTCLSDFAAGLAQSGWLSTAELVEVDDKLDAVKGEAQRLSICRLAAAVLTADGTVSTSERQIYERALERWHIPPSAVTAEILRDKPQLQDGVRQLV